MTVAIGMYQPKDSRNIGSLLRSAHLYDVDFTFQIGGVSYKYHATDTSRATQSVPHQVYDDLEQFRYLTGFGGQTGLVAVELDPRARPLSRFLHPHHAAYLLGSENRGLPPEVLDQIDHVVQVETANPWSLNVATAGAIVLHDRYVKTAMEAA